ncbi:MAG: 16S rRNA processing protein RimM [Alphaproteobacteria bacterium]|nr:16S rRNA processing protein RimM [Alphaproteobacteria bacterium]
MIPVLKIVGCHALKGGLKIQSYVEDFVGLPLTFSDGRAAKVLSFNPHNGVIFLEGVADRNAAEALRGAELFTARSNLVGDGEVLLDEVIGFAVSGGGVVVDRFNYGGGDVLEIERDGRRKCILVAQVKGIDSDAKFVEIDEDYLV